jgi:3-dehydro-L-gulonate 2-dehydrogenase
MERAIRLASEHGIGCVALRNTNHWMRGGTYGWQAVEAGYGALCWTNTLPNMPPWGSAEQRTGNNPIVMALPGSGSAETPLVLDMALSQFSYGKLDLTERKGEELVYPGGFDREGKLSRDPGEILASGRLLPVGLWKGSALSLMLDLFAALLSGGQATVHIGRQAHEYGLSQLFMAFDTKRIAGADPCDDLIREIVGFYKKNDPGVYFPGEQTLIRRRESLEKGVPVDPEYWAEIRALL